VTLEVSDDNGLTDTDSTDVTVTNVAPSLTLTSCPVAPQQVDTNVSVAGTFTDPGVNDTHTMSVDWGDGVVSPAAAATCRTAARRARSAAVVAASSRSTTVSRRCSHRTTASAPGAT